MANQTSLPEVWLRGPVEGINPALMPAAHAFLQAAEDLERVAAGLSPSELSATPGGAASIGYHLRHIAGSIDRLTTYARGEKLSDAQRAVLRSEKENPENIKEASVLVDEVVQAVHKAIGQIRSTPAAALFEPRMVGTAGLPSTVIGLLFHAAEHAQRHTGQVITTARIVQGTKP
jgi:uncharacterized damage-inducible protein DinB